ncbi:hypothetical protein ACOMHN_009715 [Nucella lapillus]
MSHFQQLSGLPYNVGEILQQFTSLPLSLIYHYTGMGLYMRALFDSQRLVDTLIHVEDRVFAAHRVVLACHSTYFAQVFLSSKHPSPKMAELRVKNIDPNMFYIVLSFLYTGQLYVNQNNVDHLLNVAHQLHVPAVLFKCLDFLDHILPNKTIDMVTEPKAVVDEAYRLMEAPLREIIHTTTFLTTSIEALEVALGQDDLPADGSPLTEMININTFLTAGIEALEVALGQGDLLVSAESEVFSAALQWLQFDLESREKYLERLMQQVRFAYMRPGEVIQAAQSSPLLKSSAYCRNRIMEAIWLMTLRGYQADDFLECGSCKPRNYLDSDEGVPQDYDNWGHARYDNLLEPAVSQPFQKQPSLTRQPSLRRNSSQSLASARQMQRRRSSHSVETARQTKRRRSSNIMPLAQLSAKSLQQPASLPSVSQQPSTRSSHTLPVYQPLPSTLLQKQPSYLQPSQLHTDLSLGGQSESADYSFPEKALMSPRSSTIAAREIPSMKLLQRQNSNVQTSSQQSSSNGSLPRRVASLRQTSSGVLPQESNSYSLLQEKLSSISRQNCSGALGHPQASFNEETQQLGQPLVPLYQRESSSALVHKKASERMLQKQPSMTQPPQQPSTVSVQRQPSYHAPLPQQQMPREVPQVAGPSAPPVIEIISPPSSIRSITKHLSKTQPSEQQIASKNSHLRGTQSTGILLKKDHSYTGVSLKQTQSGTVPQTSLKQASAGGLQQKEPSFVSLQQKEPSFVSLQQKEPSFVSLQQKSSSVFPQQRAVQPPTAPQLHPLHPPLVKLVAERKHWDAPSVSFQQPASLPPRSPPRTPPSQQPSPRPRQKEPPPRPLKREPSVTQHREPSPRPLKREPSVTQHREPSPRPLKREPSVTQHREPSPRPLKREPSVTQHREPSPRPLKREPSVTQHREPSPRPLKREPSVTQPREPSPRPLKREPSVTQHREPSPRPLKREPSVTQHREPSPRPLKREPSVTQHREPSPRPLKREPSVTQHREPSPRPLNREPSVTQHREPSPRPLKREPSIEQRREPSSTAPQSGPLPHSPVPEAPAPPSPTEEASDVEMPFFRVCRSRFLDEEVQGRVIEVEVGFSRSNHSATARTDRRHRSRSRSKERHPADGYGTGDESDAFPAGLLAIGGFVEDGDPTGKCHSHMLDAGDQKWLKMSEMPQTRLHFAAAFVREKLYVTGH